MGASNLYASLENVSIEETTLGEWRMEYPGGGDTGFDMKVLAALLTGARAWDELVDEFPDLEYSPNILTVGLAILLNRRFVLETDVRDITGYLAALTHEVEGSGGRFRRDAETVVRMIRGEVDLRGSLSDEVVDDVVQWLVPRVAGDLDLSVGDVTSVVLEASQRLRLVMEEMGRLKVDGVVVGGRSRWPRPGAEKRRSLHSRSVGRVPPPATLLGLTMRARALRNPAEAARWHAELIRTKWVGVREYTEELFDESISHVFEPGHDVGDITSFVRFMKGLYENDRLKIPIMECEAIIREGIGDDVSTDGIRWQEVMLLKQTIFVGVSDGLGYGENEINALLRDVESSLTEKGCRPAAADQIET